jgi:hypothetical protein
MRPAKRTPCLECSAGIRRAPNQIDIITEIDGISFHEAWASRVEATYEGVRVQYIGRDALIKNKRAASRPQDLADIAYLE